MGVNGGVGVQSPNQQSTLLPDAMLHNNMNVQRYDCFSLVTVINFSIQAFSKSKIVLYWL